MFPISVFVVVGKKRYAAKKILSHLSMLAAYAFLSVICVLFLTIRPATHHLPLPPAELWSHRHILSSMIFLLCFFCCHLSRWWLEIAGGALLSPSSVFFAVALFPSQVPVVNNTSVSVSLSLPLSQSQSQSTSISSTNDDYW